MGDGFEIKLMNEFGKPPERVIMREIQEKAEQVLVHDGHNKSKVYRTLSDFDGYVCYTCDLIVLFIPEHPQPKQED